MPNMQAFVEQLFDLAEDNVRRGGGPFAALVVKDGQVIAHGVNRVGANHDPTAHAEVEAIRAACQHLHHHQLSGCQVYSSCEPCPMCLGALYWARPERLIYFNSQQDAAAIGFDDQFIYQELALAPSHRRLPTEQWQHPRRLNAFELWQQLPTKVEY